MSKKYVVIVDAFSSGSSLPLRFNLLGFSCLHVLSSEKMPLFYLKKSAPKEFISKEFVFVGDINVLVAQLKEYDPQAVLCGTESGVLLADRLASLLNCVGNGVEKSLARRNKFLMAESLVKARLPAVNQCIVKNYEDARVWALNQNSWPLVVKPVDSAGSDGFSIINNAAELESSVEKLLVSDNFMGINNHSLLLQEYLVGTEFMVNTVSCEGHHQITDIWKVNKKIVENKKVYDYEDLIDPGSREALILTEYIFQVLDALSVRIGPAHSEIMLTGKGPVLIETGVRLCGGLPSSVGERCHVVSQLDLTVAAYAKSLSGFDECRSQWIGLPRAHSRCVTLCAPFSGKIARKPDFSSLEQLKSFHSFSSSLEIGDTFSKTIDLASTPGIVFLIHEEKNQIQKDYDLIRELEKTTLYSFVDKC